MFTGFASENTPAIQVWDFFRDYTGQSISSLTDDCAPIQYFRTGSNTNAIYLYLPTAPIEGKQIKIVNSRYGSSIQSINIYASDTNAGGTSRLIYTLGQGQTLDFCYSKNFISSGTTAGSFATGWITLNHSPVGASNFSSVVVGGSLNKVTSSESFIGAGRSNTVSADNSAIVSAFSSSITAGSTYSFIGGGNTNTIPAGAYVFIGGGSTNTAYGNYCFIGAGQNHTNSSNNAFISAGSRGNTRDIISYHVFPANGPLGTTSGASQAALIVLAKQTTDATATVIACNGSAASTDNQVILPNNSAYYFRGELIAGKTAAGDTKGWYIEGVIKRGANAASTAIVGTASVTSLYADAGAATWAVTATADTTNGGLAITVTGQAATTIRWVCQIRTTEMTF